MWWGRQGFYARFPICFANLGYYHLPTVCTMPIKLRFPFVPKLVVLSNASTYSTDTSGLLVMVAGSNMALSLDESNQSTTMFSPVISVLYLVGSIMENSEPLPGSETTVI